MVDFHRRTTGPPAKIAPSIKKNRQPPPTAVSAGSSSCPFSSHSPIQIHHQTKSNTQKHHRSNQIIHNQIKRITNFRTDVAVARMHPTAVRPAPLATGLPVLRRGSGGREEEPPAGPPSARRHAPPSVRPAPRGSLTPPPGSGGRRSAPSNLRHRRGPPPSSADREEGREGSRRWPPRARCKSALRG